MIERSLHTANIASAIAVLATAADLTLTGGAATTIGAALSGVSLFKGLRQPEKQQAQELAGVLDTYLSNSHLTDDRKKVVKQVFAKYPPSLDDLAEGNFVAASIAGNMCGQVKTNAVDAAHKTNIALDDYARLLKALLKPVLQANNKTEAALANLLRRTEASPAYTRMLEAGINETAIIKLARRVNEDVEDIGQAWIELESVLEIAIRVQAEGKTASNHGDFVDEVLARVADLSKDGDYGPASVEIDNALAEEEDASARRKSRLLQSGINLALLDRDPERAADLLIKDADLNNDGVAGFEELRFLQGTYYERGRDKGITLDLMVAIALAKRVLSRATTSNERGMAQIDLGNALSILGQRDSDTARLEQAVVAYEAALEEWTQGKVPLNWATTQNNLGNALQALGQRDIDTTRLEQAVVAYDAALEERTRDKVPLDWAMTQNNLGNVLKTLGERDSDTARLEQAVVAYEAALEERTRDKVPLDWAMTQNNLGTVLKTLGQSDSDTERLEKAVMAYEAALKEWTRDKVPLNWAMTQNNLGNALKILGLRDSDTAWLEQAMQAYESALKERTQDKMPLQWANTQFNLALLEVAFFKLNGQDVHIQAARDNALAAQPIFAISAPYYAGECEKLLTYIEGLGKTG